MREDIFENYQHERYIHYRLVDTGEHEIKERKKGGDVVKMRVPVLKKMKVEFEEVKNISLDRYGVQMPTYEADFTIIHNYLYDFWQPILGSEAVACYTLLKRYCYGKKDYCFPDMDTLAYKLKKSRNTVVKYLELLEQYGFIIRIWRKDVEKNNSDASPIFKIRKYTPLLSEDLINELPQSVKEEHDRYLAEIQGVDLDEKTDASQVIDGIINKSKEMKSKKDKEEAKNDEQAREYIISGLSKEQVTAWKGLLEGIQKSVSKPSFDTWFKESVIIVNGDSVSVLCPNQFTVDWIRDRYKDLITKVVKEKYDIDVKLVHVDVYGQYI